MSKPDFAAQLRALAHDYAKHALSPAERAGLMAAADEIERLRDEGQSWKQEAHEATRDFIEMYGRACRNE